MQGARIHALRLAGAAGLLLLTGCAALHTDYRRPDPGTVVSIATVPFFPQETYQCGPAALAGVLGWSGVAVTPETLVPEIYLPARRGSLQAEILGAIRRRGRIAYRLDASLDAIISELSAGHPVLVLQNLGLPRLPTWHYAVIIGIDTNRQSILLQSGTDAHKRYSLRNFQYTWQAAGYWAILALPPGEMPATADSQRYLQAVAELERLQQWQAAADGYAAAVTHWQDNAVAAFALGNSRYALGDADGAIRAYRQAIARDPTLAAAYNNLAQTLADTGRYNEAEGAALTAIELDGAQRETYQQTLMEIRHKAATSARHAH